MTDMLTRRPITEPPAADLAWHDEIDETLVCAAVVDVTHDVKSFVLQPTHPRLYRFHPGQYLTLTVLVNGEQVSRCYTIASTPLRPDTLTITVKRVPGGPVSNWLHKNLRPGGTLTVTGPLGRFSIAHHPAGKYLFLSAGSGITPAMSMIRTIHSRRDDADVIFVQNARTPDDIFFRSELAQVAAENPGIRVVTVCEEDSATEHWTDLRGRLTLPMLQAIAPDLADREIFTCGPPPYMDAIRTVLVHAGAVAERCHEETFTVSGAVVATPEPPAESITAHGNDGPTTAADPATRTFSVELRRSGCTVECAEGTTILDALTHAGLNLPSSCGAGMCGTCKTTMVSGSVEMNHAGGIRPREIAQNKILLCCSMPHEDLILDA